MVRPASVNRKKRTVKEVVTEETLDAAYSVGEGVKVGLGAGACLVTALSCVYVFGKVIGWIDPDMKTE